MNTALIGAGHASSRLVGLATRFARFSRRAGALVAGSRGARRSLSREDLAGLHERRLVAEQLRAERFRAVTLGRMV